MNATETGTAPDGKAKTVGKWSLVTVFGLISIVLLVAAKTAAGVAFACSAAIVALPLGRLARNLRWVRTIVVAALLVIAVSSIAGTDIEPEQRVTGYAVVDKPWAILQEFRDAVFGNGGTAPERGSGFKEITQETADKLAECMRNHGLSDLPDPQLTDDGISFDFSKVSESDDVIRAAQDACQYILTEGK